MGAIIVTRGCCTRICVQSEKGFGMSDTPMSDHDIPPPSQFTVYHEHRPVLYLADGKALVRAAGFMPHGVKMAVQTTGTFPQLTKPKPTKKGRGGKK